MNMRKHALPILFLLITIGISVWTYPTLPDVVPTHWGFNGKPDGYSTKLVAVSIMPIILIILYVLSLLIPKIATLKSTSNNPYVQKGAISILTLAMLMLTIVHAIMIASFNGYQIEVSIIPPLVTGVLFIATGNYLPRYQMNTTAGIRTPWSFENEQVWRKTHRYGSRIFVIGGFIMLLIPFLPAGAHFPVMIATLLLTIILTIASSYYFYKKYR